MCAAPRYPFPEMYATAGIAMFHTSLKAKGYRVLANVTIPCSK